MSRSAASDLEALRLLPAPMPPRLVVPILVAFSRSRAREHQALQLMAAGAAKRE